MAFGFDVTGKAKPAPAENVLAVRIELAGAVDEKDAFGLVEVTEKRQTNTSGKDSSGRLEIIEAEIYELLDGGGVQ